MTKERLKHMIKEYTHLYKDSDNKIVSSINYDDVCNVIDDYFDKGM